MALTIFIEVKVILAHICVGHLAVKRGYNNNINGCTGISEYSTSNVIWVSFPFFSEFLVGTSKRFIQIVISRGVRD